MPPFRGPREEEGPAEWECLLLRCAPRRFLSQTGDHRAIDPQVVQIAGGEGIEFTDRLAVDSAACAVFLHPLDRAEQAATQASVGGGVQSMSDNSHGRFLSSRLVPFPDWPGAFVGLKMDPMPRLHNARFGNAAMQQMHD